MNFQCCSRSKGKYLNFRHGDKRDAAFFKTATKMSSSKFGSLPSQKHQLYGVARGSLRLSKTSSGFREGWRTFPFLGDSTVCRAKGSPFGTFLRHPYCLTDPIFFRRLLLLLLAFFKIPL